jgi:hypothetical protein
MTMMQTSRENPIKILFTSSGAIIAIVAALFAVDSRYAHASDVAKKNEEIKLIVQQTSMNMRKQTLEDKLFELDIKKEQATNQKLSPVDSALRARYQRQLQEIIIKESK